MVKGQNRKPQSADLSRSQLGHRKKTDLLVKFTSPKKVSISFICGAWSGERLRPSGGVIIRRENVPRVPPNSLTVSLSYDSEKFMDVSISCVVLLTRLSPRQITVPRRVISRGGDNKILV